MVTSVTIQICDQIVADLTAAVVAVQLAPNFTVERKFLPRGKLETMVAQGNKVIVAGSDRQGARETRNQRKYTHSIDLALIAKVTTEESTQQEALDKLAEDLLDWYFTHPLGSNFAATLETVASKFLFEPPELFTNKIFLSVMTLNFRAFRT